MESMKLIYELSIVNEAIDSNFLEQLFKTFTPSESKAYLATLQNFSISHLENSDYRSAYHQLCDWLYGWNVNDTNHASDDPSELTTNREYREIGITLILKFRSRSVNRTSRMRKNPYNLPNPLLLFSPTTLKIPPRNRRKDPAYRLGNIR
jgi:hypothetical protein